MFWKSAIIMHWQRAIVTRAGRFDRILEPGEHWLFTTPLRPVEIETHNARGLVFRGVWADFLATERPDVITRHFTLIETNDTRIAMIYANGDLFKVLLPAKRLLLWRGVAEIAVEMATVIEGTKAKLPALPIMGRDPPAKSAALMR